MRRAPLLAALVAAALLATPVPATATPHHPGSHNPVSAGAADTFADPAVIRGRDGFWYAYGTSDPLFAGQTEPRLIPILRSRDLVDWTYVGDAFTPATRPAWATPTAGLWAPDIRYAGGPLRPVLHGHRHHPQRGRRLGDRRRHRAHADRPVDADRRPIVGPRPAPGGGFLWTFDPAGLTDAQGRRWLYYGSYFGGIFTVPLSADGLRSRARRPR